MASLAEAIRFRSLITRLNDTEFDDFILQFIHQCGRDILTTSLFNQFITSNENQQPLNTAINIVKHTIESRKKKPKIVTPDKTTINTLSSELIGELASYLFQSDHIAFSTANRSIYIGCNAPNTLTHLNLLKINDYSVVKLQKYPHLQYIAIKLKQIQQLKTPAGGTTVCNRLQRLRIDGNQLNNSELDTNLAYLVHESAINLQNINSLSCTSFGKIEMNRFSTSKFIHFLSNFTNVEAFYFKEMALTDLTDKDREELQFILPKLHSLYWLGGGTAFFFVALLNLFGSKLTGLSFFDHRSVIRLDVLSNISFSNLRQLIVLGSETMDVLDEIFKTANNIKAMELCVDKTMNNLDARHLMKRLLIQQKSLIHLYILCPTYRLHNDICNGIEQGILGMKHRKKQFALELHFSDKDKESIPINPMEDIMLTLSRITHQLQEHVLKDYFFHYSFKGIEHSDLRKEIMNFYNKKQSQLLIYPGSCSVRVSNKQCAINGWSSRNVLFGQSRDTRDMFRL